MKKRRNLQFLEHNISENKGNTDKALRYERVAIRMDEIASRLCSFSSRCARRKRVFLSIISTFFTPVLFRMASPRYFMNSLILAQCHRENTFSNILCVNKNEGGKGEGRGGDKGPPFLADTYFCRRRRSSFQALPVRDTIR